MSVSSKREDTAGKPEWPATHPHDAYARLLLGDPRRAGIFIHERLPREVVRLLADGPPEVVPSEFISDRFQRRQADVLLKVRTIIEDDPCLYVLIEAKSTLDRDVALQVHGYHEEIWAKLVRDELSETGKKPKRWPAIYTIVLYNGRSPWKNIPGSFEEWLDRGRNPVLARIPSSRFIPVSVNEIPRHQLSRDRILRAGLTFLQRPDVDDLRAVLDALPRNSDLTTPTRYYILQVYRKTLHDQVRSVLAGARWGLTRKGKGMESIADMYVEKGRAEGKADILIRLLRRRFGRVPRTVQHQISGASREQLELWADKVIDAPSLMDMFGTARKS